MKSFNYLLILLLLYSCGTNDSIIGAEQDEINDVEITVIEKYFLTSELKAVGTIENKGIATILPPWYVEGKFYADNTQATVIGGDNDKQNISLEAGESINWELIITSDELTITGANVSDYPFFDVGSLRAYKGSQGIFD